MTRTKTSPKRENVQLWPLETSPMKLKKKRRKSSSPNSADDSLFHRNLTIRGCRVSREFIDRHLVFLIFIYCPIYVLSPSQSNYKGVIIFRITYIINITDA